MNSRRYLSGLLLIGLGVAIGALCFRSSDAKLKPKALFIVKENQEISARSSCFPTPNEICKQFDYGIDDYNKAIESALRLHRQCNGLEIYIVKDVAEMVSAMRENGSYLNLYIDYYPGEPFSDWALSYSETHDWRTLPASLFRHDGIQTVKPLSRGQNVHLADEVCSFAQMLRDPW